MSTEYKITSIQAGSEKPVKDTSGTRPVYTKPLLYTLENGQAVRRRLSVITVAGKAVECVT